MEQILVKETNDFVLRVSVTPDKLKMFVDVAPVEAGQSEAAGPEGASSKKDFGQQEGVRPPKEIKRDDLLEALAQVVKAERLNLAVIDDITRYLQKGLSTEKRRIAKGVAPKRGLDGRLVYLVKPFTGEVEVEISLQGQANYAELHLFDNILRGKAIARVYPPKAGIDGVDVFGHPITAEKGAPVQVNFDQTISRRSNSGLGYSYDTLLAESAGYLSVEKGLLSIRDTLEIKGDLDYRYGNIDFVGTVVIRGGVESGFRVKAAKGIEIKGSVRGSSLICPEGKIEIGGVLGGSETSQVLSGASVKAKATQRALVECKGDIVLQRVAYRSQLRTQGALVIGEGSLVGGAAYVAKGLEAKRIGNVAGAKTIVHLCSDVRTGADYTNLIANMASHQKAIDLLTNHLGPFANCPEKLAKLTPAYREKLAKLLNKLARIKEGLQRLDQKRVALLEGESICEQITVNYKGKFYPGVEVVAGEEIFQTHEILDGPASLVFNTREQKFEIREFQQLIIKEGA